MPFAADALEKQQKRPFLTKAEIGNKTTVYS
jgi:hypothetical protein